MKTFRTAALTVAVFLSTLALAGAQTFTGTFSGANEVPPNASLGTGTANVFVNLATHVLMVQATFSNLTGTVTAAHIHAPGAPGVNAGVATQTPTFSGFPSGVTSGSYNMTFDMSLASTWNPAYVTANGGTAAGAEAAFVNAINGGMAYFNIHTSSFTGGEVRANLTVVPEPSTTAMIALGGAGVVAGIIRRRRRL